MDTYYHVIAIRPGGATKSIVNKTEDEVFEAYVVPFIRDGAITTKWGKKRQTHQVNELRIFGTDRPYDRKSRIEEFLKGKRNRFKRFAKRADELLAGPRKRCFVVMPIQGDEFGDQEPKRIWREYSARFEAIEEVVAQYDCVAIRIDKEIPLKSVVARIKEEIERADFIIADLTDERQSCYFEAGYADALDRPIIYVASKLSVMNPKEKTKIHFDIHNHVNFFGDAAELGERVGRVLEKHGEDILGQDEE